MYLLGNIIILHYKARTLRAGSVRRGARGFGLVDSGTPWAFETARCAEKGNIETVELGKVAPNRTSSKKLIKEESPADRYGRGLRR